MRPTRVLLADDDDAMRSMLADSLRGDGVHVTEVSDGQGLMRSLGHGDPSTRFDVVLTDVRMPGLNGLEVLAAQRSRDWNLAWIVMTGFGSPALHERAQRLGADLVLDKPFDLDALTTALSTIRLLQGWKS